ncbi:MAG: hypothetical protein ACJ72B_18825, partial [Ornithinibacter sp.]
DVVGALPALDRLLGACGDPAGPSGLVPFWAGILLDTLDQRPASVAAVIHGIFFGRVAPQAEQRRAITAPALVVGHPTDPFHPFADAAMLAEEMPNARFEKARGILEWRSHPERLDALAAAFALACWDDPSAVTRRRTHA